MPKFCCAPGAPAAFGLGTCLDRISDTSPVEHDLKFSPSSPESDPAGVIIVFSVAMATEAGEGETKVVDRPIWTRLAQFCVSKIDCAEGLQTFALSCFVGTTSFIDNPYRLTHRRAPTLSAKHWEQKKHSGHAHSTSNVLL